MTVVTRFLVLGCARRPNDPGAEAFVPDVAQYKRLVELVVRHGHRGPNLPPGDPNSILPIELPEGDPLLSEVFFILRDAGWSPYFGLEVPSADLFTHFQVDLIRHYEASDFDQAEYLWIRNWGDDALAYCAARRPNGWVARADSLQEEGQIGRLGGGPNRIVRDEVQQLLLSANFVGLQLDRILWDVPQTSGGNLWVMKSYLTMPRCLLNTVDLVATTKKDGTQEFVTVYDDGPYRPIELKFLRAEVSALGQFDVAHTYELVRNTRNDPDDRTLVVSQRFRTRLLEWDIGRVDFGIVRLIE